MYFEVKMRQMLLVRPCELGNGIFLQKAFVGRLLDNVNRVPCTEEHGHIVTITTIEDVSDGKIRTDTGAVAFVVDFNAVVCYLHEKELVEVEVETVSKLGCVTNAGPCSIFLPANFMPDFEFKAGIDDAYNCFNGNDGAEIRKSSIVRLEVYRKQWKAEDRSYSYIGTLARHYCGLSPAFAEVNDVLRQGDNCATIQTPSSSFPAAAGWGLDAKNGRWKHSNEDGTMEVDVNPSQEGKDADVEAVNFHLDVDSGVQEKQDTLISADIQCILDDIRATTVVVDLCDSD